MWLFGQDIYNDDIQLVHVTANDVYQAIKKGFSEDNTPNANIIAQSIHPFIILSNLNCYTRSKGRFSYTQYFCIDINDYPKGKHEFKKWKEELFNDSRIEMIFLSKNTIHIIFQLRLPCKNKKRFSAFFRIFTSRFFKEHQISQEIDNTICNPTRGIELDRDTDALIRIGSRLVILEDYENGEEANVFYERIEKHEERTRKQKKEKETSKQHHKEPNSRELNIIKNILDNGIKRYDCEKSKIYKDKQNKFEDSLSLLENELDANGIKIRSTCCCGSVRKLTIEKDGKDICFNIIFTERSFSVSSSSILAIKDLMVSTAKDIIEKYTKNIIDI